MQPWPIAKPAMMVSDNTAKTAFWGRIWMSVCDDKLEKPAHNATDSAGEEDGAGASDIGVAAFLTQVERRVVTAHGPDDADEGHKDRDAIRPFRSLIDVPPNSTGGVEA